MSAVILESVPPERVHAPSTPLTEIPPPESLAHAARADGTVIELSARRVRVELNGTHGVRRIEGDGIALTGAVLPGGVGGANLLFGPRAARRECFGRSGGIVEALQLPDALPGIVLQWWPTPAGPGTDGSLTVSVDLLPTPAAGADGGGRADEPLRAHRAPGLLWAARNERGVLLWSPDSNTPPELREDPGALRADFELAPGPEGRFSLLVQAAPPGGRWTSLRALAGVHAHHRRGENASWDAERPGLTLTTGIADVDLGLRWCRAWLRDRLLGPPGASARVHAPDAPVVAPPEGSPGGLPGPDVLTLPVGVALAAACTGDREAGRAALSALDWDQPAHRLLGALAVARWSAWTGDPEPLREVEDRLVALFTDGSALAGSDRGLVRSILGEVRDAGEAAEIPRIRELPDALEARSWRLPMAGEPRTEPPLLLRHGREGVPIPVREEEALETRRALAGVFQDPATLRSGAGLLAMLRLIPGVLGARPDAAFGRLTLSPLLPSHWTAFSARGIRVGEGGLDLDFRRTGRTVRWTLRPVAGSVPLMLVFQPWQPVSGVPEVRVDGSDAEVEVRGTGEWRRIALQLPLDGVRTVEVYGEEVSPPP